MTCLYSLFAFLRRTPRLVDQVEERVEVGGIELPIVGTGNREAGL